MILDMLQITTEYANHRCPGCLEDTFLRNTIKTPDERQWEIAGCIDPDCDHFNPAALIGQAKSLQEQNQRLLEMSTEQMGQIRELQIKLAETPEELQQIAESAFLAGMSGTHYEKLQEANAKIERFQTRQSEIDDVIAKTIVQAKQVIEENGTLKAALSNLLSHVTMIGITEGFPIEVEPDPEYPAFDIMAALIQAAAALGQDDQELRSYFPEMFKEE